MKDNALEREGTENDRERDRERVIGGFEAPSPMPALAHIGQIRPGPAPPVVFFLPGFFYWPRFFYVKIRNKAR